MKHAWHCLHGILHGNAYAISASNKDQQKTSTWQNQQHKHMTTFPTSRKYGVLEKFI